MNTITIDKIQETINIEKTTKATSRPNKAEVTIIRGKKAICRLVKENTNEQMKMEGSLNLYFKKNGQHKNNRFKIAIQRVDLKAMGAKTIEEAAAMAVNTGRVATIEEIEEIEEIAEVEQAQEVKNEIIKPAHKKSPTENVVASENSEEQKS